MKLFTAQFSIGNSYGRQICTADTIEELLHILINRGYEFHSGEKDKIIAWSKTTNKKYYSMGTEIRRGELEMTEYTSF